MIPIIVVGGGGHAKVVIDLLHASGLYDPVECTDAACAAGEVLGIPVRGGDERLDALLSEGVRHIALAVGDNAVRRRLGESLTARGFVAPCLIHPSAVVAPSACVGEGTVVLARAVVNATAQVGRFCIVNTGAIVEHDCGLEDGAHLASGATLAGGVRLGREVLFGAGAVAVPGARVGARSVVGAGAVVVGAVAADVTVTGCPARVKA